MLLIGFKILSQHDQSETLCVLKRVREISPHLIIHLRNERRNSILLRIEKEKILSQHDQSETLCLPKRVREISPHLIKFSSGVSNDDSREEHKYGIIKQQTIFAQLLITKKYLLGELLTSYLIERI